MIEEELSVRAMAGVSIAWFTVCLIVLTHTADIGELSMVIRYYNYIAGISFVGAYKLPR